MTLVLSSLAVLGIGAILSLLLIRQPRLGLLSAMSAIGVSSALCIVAAVSVLVPSAAALPGAPRLFAWPLPLGSVTLCLDGLSAWFLLTISLLAAAVAVYSPAYMRGEIGREPVPAFSALLCLLVASLLVLVCAADTVLFLVAWEAMTLCAFLLVGFHNRDEQVRRGAWMYLIATHLGTALCVLPMFAILIARAGATGFASFAPALRSMPPGVCVLLFGLGLVGFGTKAGFMPMHVWLPSAHPVAPTPVSAFLSGVVIKTGIYGLLRLLTWLGPLPSGCALTVLAIGIISGVLGVAYALAQHDIKRLLAYHSVENIGIIGLGIGMGMLGQATGHPALAALGYAGALLHVMNHALFKGLLFLSAGAVIHSTGTGQIDRLGGLARRTPINALLFLVAAVSICGLPPFNGFVSEWLIYGALFGGAASLRSAGAVVGLTALAIMGGLALACFAKVFSVVFLGEPREPHIHPHPTPVLMGCGMAILAALCILIGALPSLVVPLAAPAVHGLTQLTAGQFAAALDRWLAPIWTITFLAVLLASLTAILAVVRHRAVTSNAPALPSPIGTWGCGYAFPTARMQYTASSFAWSLIQSLRHFLWPQKHLAGPAGYFPANGQLSTHVEDVAQTDVFAPLFHGVAHLALMVRTVSWTGQPAATAPAHAQGDPEQRVGPFGAARRVLLAAARRGTIHVCLAYIVLVLVLLFLVEALVAPWPARSPAASPKPAAVGIHMSGGASR